MIQKNLVVLIICGIIILVSIILQSIFKKVKKLDESNLRYYLIEVLGVLVPALIIVVNYCYYHTDTIREFTISSVLFTGAIISWYLFLKFIRIKRYNYIFFLFWIIICHFIFYYTNTLMIKTLNFGTLNLAIITVSTSFHNNKNRRKLIITGIFFVCILLILQYISSNEMIRISEKDSKPNRIASEYISNNGYMVEEDDQFIILGDPVRGEETKIMIVRLDKNNNSPEILRHLELLYYEGKILEFKDFTKRN